MIDLSFYCVWLIVFPVCFIQYIQQQIRADCTNITSILEAPEGQDEGVWKYEHLRLVTELTYFNQSIINQATIYVNVVLKCSHQSIQIQFN